VGRGAENAEPEEDGPQTTAQLNLPVMHAV